MTGPSFVGLRGLYAIVDPSNCREKDPLRVARDILNGGCAVLQLRAKGFSDKALVSLATELATLCRTAHVPFFVNDRPDIALIANADGVHLGQDDIDIWNARRILGNRPIGISTHTPEQAARATGEGADLIGYGPVFPTLTKKINDHVVGTAELASVYRCARVPVVAIGGITPENLASVVDTGVALVAAISALCGADDPCQAARTMHRTILEFPRS